MKKDKKRDSFLEQLRRIPIVQVACEKTAISRNSVYRWRKEDEEFKKAMDEAMTDGEAFVNDMSESQLLSLIQEKNWSAISFWLRHRNPKYKDRVEVTTKVEDGGKLTPEQEVVVREALRLASIMHVTKDKNEQYDSTGTGGQDDTGSENTNINH
jgi:hypothetical protein